MLTLFVVIIFFTGFLIGLKVAYTDVELLERNRKEIIQDMKNKFMSGIKLIKINKSVYFIKLYYKI